MMRIRSGSPFMAEWYRQLVYRHSPTAMAVRPQVHADGRKFASADLNVGFLAKGMAYKGRNLTPGFDVIDDDRVLKIVRTVV